MKGQYRTSPRNSGGIPYISTRFSLSIEMSRLTRDETAEPVSRDQILRHERGRGNNIHFSCSADHVQDWQPYYPVDPYSCYMCDRTYTHIHTLPYFFFFLFSPIQQTTSGIGHRVK